MFRLYRFDLYRSNADRFIGCSYAEPWNDAMTGLVLNLSKPISITPSKSPISLRNLLKKYLKHFVKYFLEIRKSGFKLSVKLSFKSRFKLSSKWG